MSQDPSGQTETTTYADLEIRLLKAEDQGYPIEITLDSDQQFPRGYLPRSFVPWLPSGSPAEDGGRLFAALLADDRVKTAWAEARGKRAGRRIRLRIDAAAPELHAVPWELLREAGEGSAALDLAAASATPFSRYLAGTWQPGSPILKRPIRILVAVSNPSNLDRWELQPIKPDEEWSLLQQATQGLEDVELVQLPQPCTLAALEAELRKGYHILHFVGHGVYDADKQQAALLLSGPAPECKVTPVPDRELAEMLARQLGDPGVKQDDKLRLVFLASCQTATRSPADAFRGMAPALVAAGVPAVLAMQDLVPVDTAREFACTFYRQLLRHGQVDLAANQARSALLTARLPGASIPVLFLRLRSGELLGRRGRITSQQTERFWPLLLDNVYNGFCTPFLGPRANAGVLPSSEALAEKLAVDYGYPLPNRQNLVGVLQFMASSDAMAARRGYMNQLKESMFEYQGVKLTKEDRRRVRGLTFGKAAEDLQWAERVLAVQENEIHHLLAGLPFSLYVTTNVDDFMEQALQHKGRPPRREGPRWVPQPGVPKYALSPEPSEAEPVVFHLNGYDGDPDWQRYMVLSEDDYLAHLVRLSRDQDSILPANLLGKLAEHSFLFIGYNIDDWESRVLLQGLLKPISQMGGAKVHVGVQLEAEQTPDARKALDYIRQYLGRFSIDVYWGTPLQFVTELHSRWQEYMEENDD
jgi:hypothetical protein